MTNSIILILLVLNMSQSLISSSRIDSRLMSDAKMKYKFGLGDTKLTSPQPNLPRQSPVDVITCLAVPGNFPELHVKSSCLQTAQSMVTNNGHTVQISLSGSDCTPSFTGGPAQNQFDFVQMHIHWGEQDNWGSEHLLNGEGYSSEIHCVFYNTKYSGYTEAQQEEDGLAVIGVFAKAVNEDNPKLDSLISLIPDITTAGSDAELDDAEALQWAFSVVDSAARNLKNPKILKKHGYFSYNGSLTTSPYSENVYWIVLPTHSFLGSNQIAAFRTLQTSNGTNNVDNKRPVQPLFKRQISFSKKLSSS